MTRHTPALLRLARAAIRMADEIRLAPHLRDDNRFMACDEELREAAIGYREILDPHDVSRIGYGKRTVAR